MLKTKSKKQHSAIYFELEGLPSESTVGPPPIGGPEPNWIKGQYTDHIWEAKTINPAMGRPYRIRFGTVPVQYIDVAKSYIWALEYVTDPRLSRSACKSPGAIAGQFNELRAILRLLDSRGHGALSKLSKKAIMDLAIERLDIRSRTGPSLRRKLSYNAVKKTLVVLERLYGFGPSLLNISVDGFSHTIDEGAKQSLIRLNARKSTPTKELSETVGRQVLRSAIYWVEHLSPHILALRDCGLALQQHLIATDKKYVTKSGWKDKQRHAVPFLTRRDIKARIDDALFHLPFNASEVLSYHRDYSRRVEPSSQDQRFLHGNFILITNTLCQLLVAASYLTIVGFSGFRSSEIASIQRGSAFWKAGRGTLRTTVLKTSDRISGREVERTVPEIVIKAVELMETYAKPYANQDTERIWYTGRAGKMTHDWLRPRIREFARFTCQLEESIKPHQFRRLFALLWVRRFRGTEDGLRRHFRHTSRDMIHAYIADACGAKFLAAEKTKLAGEIMTSLISGDKAYVARDLGFVQQKAVASYRARNLPIEEIERLIANMLKSRYIEVFANEWGYCLLQSFDQDGAACGSTNGLPNDANSCPETCGRCRHFAVGAENILFWNTTRLVHEAVLSSEHATILLKRASAEMYKVTRYELTDRQWQRLEPLLPPERPPTGRPNHHHRTILNSISGFQLPKAGNADNARALGRGGETLADLLGRVCKGL